MNDAGKKKDKHHNAQNDPIEAEDLKPVFLEVIYKEANGKQSDDKGDHGTNT